MTTLKSFFTLCRMDRLIGVELLFMPCVWGMILGLQQENALKTWIHQSWFFNISYTLFLLFLGSFSLRSAGCIWNDWVDQSLDARVKRTQNRPFAANVLTLRQTLPGVCLLLCLGLVVMLQLPQRIWWLCLLGFLLSILYPQTKYFVFFPQVVLGITFNLGVFVGWGIFYPHVHFSVALLFLAGTLLTTVYDTIYGFQDLEEDRTQGVGSMAILVKKHPKIFVTLGYSLCLICFERAGISKIVLGITGVLIGYQIFMWEPSKNSGDMFFKNRWLVRIITVGLIH